MTGIEENVRLIPALDVKPQAPSEVGEEKPVLFGILIIVLSLGLLGLGIYKFWEEFHRR